MSVARPIKLLIGLTALLVLLALVLPYLLATRTTGLPFQRAVMLFQPMLEDAFQPYPVREGDAIAGLIVLGGNTTRVAAPNAFWRNIRKRARSFPVRDTTKSP